MTLGPGDYSIEETAFWSERVYSHVFRLLNEYNVVLDAILLKPNMCLPGEGRGGEVVIAVVVGGGVTIQEAGVGEGRVTCGPAANMCRDVRCRQQTGPP